MKASMVLAVGLATGLLGSFRVVAEAAPACRGGRFLVEGPPLISATLNGEPDAVVIDGISVSLMSGCGATSARIRVAKRGTKVNAVWPSCGGLRGKARLKARIDRTCKTMTGTLRARRERWKRSFSAELSECGDGIVDIDGGEECDPPGTVACDDRCHFTATTSTTVPPPPTTSSTTTTTTTLTTTSTTQPPTTSTSSTSSTTSSTSTTTSTSSTTSTTTPQQNTSATHPPHPTHRSSDLLYCRLRCSLPLHYHHHHHRATTADHVIDHHDHNHTNHDLHYSTAHDEHVLDEFDDLLHEHNNLHIEHDLHNGATPQHPHHYRDHNHTQPTPHHPHGHGDRREHDRPHHRPKQHPHPHAQRDQHLP